MQCENTIKKNKAKEIENIISIIKEPTRPLSVKHIECKISETPVITDEFKCVSCGDTNKVLQSPVDKTYCNYCWTKLIC